MIEICESPCRARSRNARCRRSCPPPRPGKATLTHHHCRACLDGKARRYRLALNSKCVFLRTLSLTFRRAGDRFELMPKESTPSPLSRRERQIMDILYKRKQATAAQVLESMPDPPGYSAV